MNIVLKDRFKSVITPEEIEKYRKQAKASDVQNNGARLGYNADELVNGGIKKQKERNFKIATEAERGL